MENQQQISMALSVAEKREMAALKKLNQLHSLFDQEKQQLQLLQRYQQEYSNKLNTNKEKIITTGLHNNIQEFIQQINKNIQRQKDQLESTQADIERQIVLWHEFNKRTEMIKNILQQMQDQKNAQAQLLEQKLQDELFQLKRAINEAEH